MKKQYREISVNDIPYGWVIDNNCDGDDSNMLIIYFDKRIIHKQLFEGFINITLKIVYEIILSLND